MRKVRNDLFLKAFLLFLVLFTFFFVLSYSLSREYLLKLLSTSNSDTLNAVDSFDSLWLGLGFVSFIFVVVLYFVLKNINKKVNEDIQEINNYLVEISENKNYDAIVKINNYLEFLQISLVLKNIVKRLKQRDKKSSKK